MMLYGILMICSLAILTLLFIGCRHIQKKAASGAGSTATLPVSSRYRAFLLYLALMTAGLVLLNLVASMIR